MLRGLARIGCAEALAEPPPQREPPPPPPARKKKPPPPPPPREKKPANFVLDVAEGASATRAPPPPPPKRDIKRPPPPPPRMRAVATRAVPPRTVRVSAVGSAKWAILRGMFDDGTFIRKAIATGYISHTASLYRIVKEGGKKLMENAALLTAANKPKEVSALAEGKDGGGGVMVYPPELRQIRYEGASEAAFG